MLTAIRAKQIANMSLITAMEQQFTDSRIALSLSFIVISFSSRKRQKEGVVRRVLDSKGVGGKNPRKQTHVNLSARWLRLFEKCMAKKSTA